MAEYGHSSVVTQPLHHQLKKQTWKHFSLLLIYHPRYKEAVGEKSFTREQTLLKHFENLNFRFLSQPSAFDIFQYINKVMAQISQF